MVVLQAVLTLAVFKFCKNYKRRVAQQLYNLAIIVDSFFSI
jgi:hypothetical protein